MVVLSLNCVPIVTVTTDHFLFPNPAVIGGGSCNPTEWEAS